MTVAALISFFQVVSVLGSALVAVKLYSSGLYRRYRIFFIFFVFRNPLSDLFLDSIPPWPEFP